MARLAFLQNGSDNWKPKTNGRPRTMSRRHRYRRITGAAFAITAVLIAGYVYYPKNIVLPNLEQNAPPSIKYVKTPEFIEGEFTARVDFPLNRQTLVRYIVPLDPAAGNPRPSANNIVFYAPYNGDARRIQAGFPPWTRRFADEQGYSVFTLTIEADTEITGDPSQYYIYREAGWFDLVFAIKAHLEKEFSLEERPLLIVGESSGGSMAQRMAVAYPDRIAAAAWNGGSRYAEFERPIDVALLALNNWSCYGLASTREMVEDAMAKGVAIVNAQTPPPLAPSGKYDAHASSESTYRLIQAFIEGVVELGKDSGGKPPPDRWPFSAKCGDAATRLPSEAFARLWESLPLDTVRRIDAGGGGWIMFPPPADPEALVLTAFPREDAVFLKNSLYFLSRRRAAAAAAFVDGPPEESVKRMESLLSEAMRKEAWKSLPVVLYGRGLPGQILAVAGLRNANRRITRIALWESEWRSPFPELSISGTPNPSNIPVTLYYGGGRAVESPERKDFTVVNIPRASPELAQFDIAKGFTSPSPE